MSDATASPSTPAPTTAPAAPPASAAKPAPGTPAMADFYAAQAAKAVIADKVAAEEGLAAARGETPPAADATPERGKDGKFKPKGKTDAKQAAKAPVAQAADESDPGVGAEDAADAGAADAGRNVAEVGEAVQGGGLGRARRFIREGDIAKALELIGLHPDKLEGRQWGAFRQREAAAKELERTAAAREEQLAQTARQLEQRFARMAAAQKAYEAEDYDSAFKLAFNEDANDYQRKRVAAMTTKDPKVAQLEKRLREFEQKQTQDAEQAKVRKAEADRASAQEAYREKLATDIADIGDERFAKAATKKAFIHKVFEIQQQHWNERTGQTLDTVEAAELAWEELYDGVAGDAGTTTASSVSKSAGATQTPVRRAAKAATTLNPHEAAEAAPAPKLAPGSAALREKYARMAELAALESRSG